jgi:D-alanyl-D-alanine carboxypeptidase/D-alanyl-D-alanine-endopeptidase (penicillin-binding protein 4)
MVVTVLSQFWLAILPFDAEAAIQTQLPKAVRDALSQARIPVQSLGIFVQDVTASHPRLAVHAQQARNPASVIKLLTTIVALEVLGPAYQFRTEAYLDGPLVDGRVQGNLILKGYGDPWLAAEVFWAFVQSIRDRGIRHIEGDLVLDNRFFEPPEQQPGAFDGQPHRLYNAIPAPLLLNFQATEFQFSPDTRTGKVSIAPYPRQSNLHIDNRLKPVPGRCRGRHHGIRMRVIRKQGGSRVRFTGDYPLVCGEMVLHRVVQQPVPHLFGAFHALWQEMGGTLGGRFRLGAVPKQARKIYVRNSRPLAELIRGINKFSNNVMARQLLLTLSAEQYGMPGTVDKGRQAIGAWLRQNDISSTGLVIDNGAGLSRRVRITPATLGHVLHRAYASIYRPEFLASLPLAGLDGTMRRRFKADPLTGRARIKTGSLNRVRAMGGYVLGRQERQWVVVAMLNHARANGRRGRAVMDAILRWVAAQ